jgi:hypothetical protein
MLMLVYLGGGAGGGGWLVIAGGAVVVLQAVPSFFRWRRCRGEEVLGQEHVAGMVLSRV